MTESCIHLLASLLAFDPAKRLSVDEALRHPFLAAFYSEDKMAQAVCPQPMSVALETIGEDADHIYDNVSRVE